MCSWIFSPSDPKWHLSLCLNSWKTHCPISQMLLTVIHLFILPCFFSLFLFFLGSMRLMQLVLFVVFSLCLVSHHVCWRMALGVKWLSYDCKGLRGFLMETCLLSPVGYPTSAISSWGRGEGWRVGERREWGLPESTCRALRPTCQQPSDIRFLFHSVSAAFWHYFSITSSASVSLLTHLSLCLSPSLLLHFTSASTVQNK